MNWLDDRWQRLERWVRGEKPPAKPTSTHAAAFRGTFAAGGMLRSTLTPVQPACDDAPSENTTKEDEVQEPAKGTRHRLILDALREHCHHDSKDGCLTCLELANAVEAAFGVAIAGGSSFVVTDSPHPADPPPPPHPELEQVRRERDAAAQKLLQVTSEVDDAKDQIAGEINVTALLGRIEAIVGEPIVNAGSHEQASGRVYLAEQERDEAKELQRIAQRDLDHASQQFDALARLAKILLGHLAGEQPAWWVDAADALRGMEALIPAEDVSESAEELADAIANHVKGVQRGERQ